jgi:hypothetical protein
MKRPSPQCKHVGDILLHLDPMWPTPWQLKHRDNCNTPCCMKPIRIPETSTFSNYSMSSGNPPRPYQGQNHRLVCSEKPLTERNLELGTRQSRSRKLWNRHNGASHEEMLEKSLNDEWKSDLRRTQSLSARRVCASLAKLTPTILPLRGSWRILSIRTVMFNAKIAIWLLLPLNSNTYYPTPSIMTVQFLVT